MPLCSSFTSSRSHSLFFFSHALAFLLSRDFFPVPALSFPSSVSHGVRLGPLLGVPDGLGLVDLPQLCDVVGQGVVGVGGGQEGLDGQQHRADLQGGAPLVWNERRKEDDYAPRAAFFWLKVPFRISRQIRPSLSMLGW